MATEALDERVLGAWLPYLRGHAALTRRLSARLAAEHGLTLNDYEALLVLSRAPGRRRKRVELAQEVLLTPSGITRLLQGLEAAGLVAREPCATDARVTYAVLTAAGDEALRAAARTHAAGVAELFGARFDDAELETLRGLLGRLDPEGDADGACEPG